MLVPFSQLLDLPFVEFQLAHIDFEAEIEFVGIEPLGRAPVLLDLDVLVLEQLDSGQLGFAQSELLPLEAFDLLV